MSTDYEMTEYYHEDSINGVGFVPGSWAVTIPGFNYLLNMSMPTLSQSTVTRINTPLTTITNGGSGGVGTYTYGCIPSLPHTVSGVGNSGTLIATVEYVELYDSDYIEYALTDEDWTIDPQLSLYINPYPADPPDYYKLGWITSSNYRYTINIYGVK